MNFYPHHIGDFNNATRHLTRIERSVYRDMLDMYYDTELPLPLDEKALCRKLLARSDEESTAVEQVLNEFFTKTAQGWHHSRCEQEIRDYHTNISAKSAAGKASAAKRESDRLARLEELNSSSTAAQQPLDSVGSSVQPTRTMNHEPLTNNQEPKEHMPQAAPAAPKKSKSSKTTLPNGFAISDAVRQWAASSGHSNLQAHFDNFVGACKAKGYTYVDWDSALQNAIRSDWAKLAQARAGPAAKQSRHSGFDKVDYSEGVTADGRID